MALVLVVAVVSSVASWQLARRMESPTQVAARAEAPEAIPVTAGLRRGILEPPLSLQARVGRARGTAVRIDELTDGVVTAGGVPVGAEVVAGTMLLRVNGRPLFVLPGPFPLYRDLSGGETGDDVAALQSGLEAVGLSIGDQPGMFGPSTKAALEQLYSRAGEQAPTGDAVVREELAVLEAELTASEGPFDPSTLERRRELQQALGADLLVAEIVMAPELPATLESVTSVGQRVSGEEPLARLGSGPTVLRAEVPAGSAEMLVAGAVGTVEAAGGSVEVSVLDVRGGDDPEMVEVVMAGDGPLEAGEKVLVRFADQGGEEQLLAPAASVVTRSGASFVYVSRGDRFEEVEVEVLGVDGGTAAIRARSDDVDLDVGLMVRVAG